ncbi:minor capsid protein [Nocardia acidivorans]|uniref:minor capsid protein n=1 Tax=Nocardia acidivorans TaxID=404580 RepID=UPI0008322245|nr:minor capsid protein [Nocardia acidivorans]
MAFSMRWDGRQIAASASTGLNEGLFQAAEVLLAQANSLVPIEEGHLQNSGVAEVRDGKGRVGFNTPYALRQHEDLTYRHPNGRSAKYLEKPLNQFGPELEAIVAAAVTRWIGS